MEAMEVDEDPAAARRSTRSGYGRMSERSAWNIAAMSEKEMDEMMAQFTREDTDRRVKKSWSRIFVEKTLLKYKWYNPQRDDPDAPSLEKAWAYYEHITLARRFTGDQAMEGTLQRAEPGETSDTELYGAFRTPEAALNEWGIGVGIYFSTVRIMSIMFLLCGLINVYNIIYYRSEAYNGAGGQSGLILPLKGTAICTNREWVVCEDGCDRTDQSGWKYRQEQYATGIDPFTGNQLTFVQRTLCLGAQLPQGMINFASLIFLVLCFALLTWYQIKREVRFDEDKSTARDYSIKVCNPPPDAYDPDQWRDFFEQFSSKQVVFVTVALDNEPLLNALFLRRIFIDKLRRRLPEGVDMEDEEQVKREVDALLVQNESRERGCLERVCSCTVVPILRLFNFFLSADDLFERIKLWTDKVKEAQNRKYNVAEVYVTFETEEGQRAALAALSVSKLDLWRQNKNAVAPNALFRGKVLKVVEPAEPNSVRWQDLHVPIVKKYLLEFITFCIVIGLVIASGFAIDEARDVNLRFYGVCVSVFNFLIPNVAKLLMLLERHSTEGAVQKSMYFKITVFRWFNTVILTLIVTPFVDTLGGRSRDLLPSINTVLLTEMILTPCLRLLDIVGNIRKHILAPRSKTQEMMNLNFTGTIYNLGERYTDFTKVIFLVVFYSALNPNAFFIGFATLLIQYYVDKFCLMRIWASAPFIGTQLAVFSRRYFFTVALLLMAVVSSYFWAQFPSDNVCPCVRANSNSVSQGCRGGWSGSYDVMFGTGTTGTIEVTEDEGVIFCQQQIRRFEGFGFPAVSEVQEESEGEWMTESQEKLTDIYGWSSVVALAVFIAVVFGGAIINGVLSLCRGTYSVSMFFVSLLTRWLCLVF
uniref:CSC1/OSCA1-like cytosolic domain-containing protein n=1 Tax=Pseudictyota dubia TaxID=2749911 RepID=A0A7R9VPM3_9STRA|mmetsp:Transcript_19591/g.36751  ORF Transcript_19591/g.36751 Transcript_19591/m.36751 type:complete len:870 (+) Transcript_19591:179-2788(+)